jgi:hypothetical protein
MTRSILLAVLLALALTACGKKEEAAPAVEAAVEAAVNPAVEAAVDAAVKAVDKAAPAEAAK